jgi:hypothetical protein
VQINELMVQGVENSDFGAQPRAEFYEKCKLVYARLRALGSQFPSALCCTLVGHRNVYRVDSPLHQLYQRGPRQPSYYNSLACYNLTHFCQLLGCNRAWYTAC